MNTINEAGFLSEDINQWIDKNRKENLDIFNLIFDFNKFAQKLFFEIVVHKDEARELLLSTLYIRSLSIFQSTITLAERGFESETRILIRSLMEVMFTLVASVKNENTADKIILSEYIDTLKTIRRLKNYKGPIDDFGNIKDLLDREKHLEKEVGEKNIKNLSVAELSVLSGLQKNYLSI